MNNAYRFLRILILLLVCTWVGTNLGFASVNLPWSTTYNCSEWTQGGSLNCDGLQPSGGWTTVKGSREQITSAANNPIGVGRGQRHWIGGGSSGVNDNSGGTAIYFSGGQNELWVRWYMRFQQGFQWSSYQGYKTLYFLQGPGQVHNYFEIAQSPSGTLRYYEQSGGLQVHRPPDYFGWESIFNGRNSDGTWHCYEIYIKSESSGSNNGIFRAWVDGDLKINATNVNHGLASRGRSLAGFIIGENAKVFPTNSPDMYVDYDDFYVTRVAPAGRDARGNPMIGTLGGASNPSPTPTLAPVANFSSNIVSGTAPVTVNFNCTSSNSPTAWAWDFDNNGTTNSTQANPSFVYNTPGTYTVRMTATNSGGSNTVTKTNYITVNSPTVTTTPTSSTNTVFIAENFNDGNFSSRGWYDNTSPVRSTAERIPGSTSSLEYRFARGATTPVQGGSMRRKFTASDEIYVSFHIKHSSNWVGSNQAYHPHLFYLLTNKSSDWNNLAFTHLTAYVEIPGGYPQIGIQDGVNIDQSRIGQNLVNSTENRAVAGCNGDSDGFGNGSCYQAGQNQYWNWKQWRTATQYFTNTQGTRYKGDWHFVEAYIKLNTVSGGRGQKDGIMTLWVNGNQVMNHTNLVMRTGANADMRFNQFVIGPYIGDGSPADQTFWIDSLTVANQRPNTGGGSGGTVVPIPINFRIVQ